MTRWPSSLRSLKVWPFPELSLDASRIIGQSGEVEQGGLLSGALTRGRGAKFDRVRGGQYYGLGVDGLVELGAMNMRMARKGVE
ncbi:MAG: hypothetical protein HZB26_17745 [Candidatus Hydrogenedentes bacterium]|nr:hypothetical protein [Candidatus Hydrogenedentota bacterium]